jgi:hypothetical protein
MVGFDGEQVSYRFSPHFHPYVQELMQELVEGSVSELQAMDTKDPPLRRNLFSKSDYRPTERVEAAPVADLDFSATGAYSVYNWELFFHVPVTIAMHLSKNGRFEEAQRWFHFVFDPTDDSEGPTPERFWKSAPLHTTLDGALEEVLKSISDGSHPLHADTMAAISAWQENPFRPHLVAGYRPSAYQTFTLMAYLDNLVAWGDALFGQDTTETVSEATQLYVLAANLLGRRPQQVPRKKTALPQTYKSLRERLGAVAELENTLPFDDQFTTSLKEASGGTRQLDTLGLAYFCTPYNEKLFGYWDTVADRLFKLRNSLNLSGVFRQLPLFDPPIDPAMLARAASAGVDVAAVLAGGNQPMPLVRFEVLASKAGELCQEVKSLGSALLSAIEKQDGEALALLRARHETSTLKLAETVKYAQWQESIKNREALEASMEVVRSRYTFYQRLLGIATEEITFPKSEPLDTSGLQNGRFASTEAAMEPVVIDIDIDDSPIPALLAEGKKISKHEARELALLELSQATQDYAAIADSLASALNAIPLFSIDVKPIGTGAGTTFGGPNLAAIVSGSAGVHRAIAGRLTHESGRAARIGGYSRREQDWQYQSNSAAGEINQILKQLRAAEIREFMAERELGIHRQQTTQARAIEDFLTGEQPNGRTSTTAYYAFMRREVRTLYNRAYELAVETAQKAERALRNELGDPELKFVQASYLAGSEGLFAGEKLHLDIRRMELAQLDLNRREYELTKNVSMLQLAPIELVRLRTTGRATITIPEEIFDLDTPGHYFRRIRSVSLSIPCITGPYTGVACTARLRHSCVRTSPALKDGTYVELSEGDERFNHQLGATEAIVTSSGSYDSGLFETNPRDQRLLPFEYRGAAGEWQLELTSGPRPFDYDTITDVILHIHYTARDGGQLLRDAASSNLQAQIESGTATGSSRLLSIRHEFPSEWHRFTATDAGPGTETRPRAGLTLNLRREHYPYFAGAGPSALAGVQLIARPKDSFVGDVSVADQKIDSQTEQTRKISLVKRPDLGDLRWGTLGDGVTDGSKWGSLPAPMGQLAIYVDTNLEELFVVLTWK